MRQIILLIFAWLPVFQFAQSNWSLPAYSGDEVDADIQLLHKVLTESHPGITTYISQNEFEEMFSAVEVGSDVSPKKAYQIVSGLIDGIHDGHTWVLPAESNIRSILENELFIPFSIAVSGQKIVVFQDLSGNEILDAGVELTAINNIDIREVVVNLMPYVTADGFNVSGKLSALNEQFWWYLGLHYGFPEKYTISCRTADGNVQTVTVDAIPMEKRVSAIYELYPKYTEMNEVLNWSFDNKTAYLRIPRFSGMKLKTFHANMERFFTEVSDAGANELVIDIRGNGGGMEGYENILLSYLNTLPVNRYNAVFMSNPRSSFYRHLKGGGFRWLEDLLYASIEFKKAEENKWNRRSRYKRTNFCPKHVFNGKVYIWVDGDVFSGASEFASLARCYVDDCELIGLPTCGGQGGHTSGYYYRLILPNTKLEINIPRVRFDLAISQPRTLGGLKPDILIEGNVWENDNPIAVFRKALYGRDFVHSDY